MARDGGKSFIIADSNMFKIEQTYMETGDGRIRVGRSCRGEWVAVVAGNTIILRLRKNYLGLLPLLESDPARVIQNAAVEFPAQELIRFALEFGSGYWIELALEWLEALKVWDEEIAGRLQEISRNLGWAHELRSSVNRVLAEH